MEQSPIEVEAPTGRKPVFWLIAGLVTVLPIALLVPAFFTPIAWRDMGVDWVESLGVWGPVIFVAAFTATTIGLIPPTPLTWVAGVAFGFLAGTAYVSLGSTLGALFAFVIGRHTAAGWVRGKIGGKGTLRAIDKAVETMGWRIVFLSRLSPLFPFTVLNYAFGLSRVRVVSYTVSSFLGMLPGTAAAVYLGSLARPKAIDGVEKSVVEYTVVGIALIATIAIIVMATKAVRKALRSNDTESAHPGS